jgi:hypothetical protein
LTTDKQMENNVIYIIFSPQEFSKASDTQSDRQLEMEGIDGLPRELTFSKFQAWLSKNQGSDEKMGVTPIPITIKK